MTEPCAGVLMPRSWAVECALLKKKPPAVAPAPATWYASPWAPVLVGVVGAALGGTVVWAAMR